MRCPICEECERIVGDTKIHGDGLGLENLPSAKLSKRGTRVSWSIGGHSSAVGLRAPCLCQRGSKEEIPDECLGLDDFTAFRYGIHDTRVNGLYWWSTLDLEDDDTVDDGRGAGVRFAGTRSIQPCNQT